MLIKKIYESYSWHKFVSQWRKINAHNFTYPLRRFRIENVIVGKNTYGGLNVTDDENIDCAIRGGAKLEIGNYCSISHTSQFLLGAEHSYKNISTYPFKVILFDEKYEAYSKGSIIVNDDVWIGTQSLILGGVTIGKGSIVGAGSVVTKNVAPYSIVCGNPAVFRKFRFSENLIKKLMDIDLTKIYDNITNDDLSLLYTPLQESVLEKLINKFVM